MSCIVKVGVLLGTRKYEWCFDVQTLMLWAPRWLFRQTPQLEKGGTP